MKLERAKVNSLPLLVQEKLYTHIREQEHEIDAERERNGEIERGWESNKWTDGSWMNDLKLVSKDNDSDEDMQIIWDCEE